jgi:hypothetical protein
MKTTEDKSILAALDMDALAQEVEAMVGWQDIATAPKDGTVIDLWMIDETGREWREANAYFLKDGIYEVYVWNPAGGFGEGGFERSGYGKRDGWQAPGHDYDGQDGWCDQPEYFNPHPRQNKVVFTKPTHWRPQPSPPPSAPAKEGSRDS